MSGGPGKYDEVCTIARQAAQAGGCVVIVANGKHGSGFSVQSEDPGFVNALPKILRDVAGQIDADLQASADLKSVRRSRVVGVLATAADDDQAYHFWTAVAPMANVIQSESLTTHYTVFAEDMGKVLELARSMKITVQKIIGAGASETYELLHQGTAEAWRPTERRPA